MGMQMNKDWGLEAACREAPKKVFYPGRSGSYHRAAATAWKDFCWTCPVWNECFEASADEEWGIWAGLTYDQRVRYQGNPKAARASAMERHLQLKEAA